MAIGCLVLALDGIGPVAVWLKATQLFFSGENDLVSRVFQDVLPVLCLLGAPLAAWRLGSLSHPKIVPRIRSTGRVVIRLKQNFSFAFGGALAVILATSLSDTFSSFFTDIDLTAEMAAVLVAAVLAGGALVWPFRWGKVGVCLVILGLTALQVASDILAVESGDRPTFAELAQYGWSTIIWAVLGSLFAVWLTSDVADAISQSITVPRLWAGVPLAAFPIAFSVWLIWIFPSSPYGGSLINIVDVSEDAASWGFVAGLLAGVTAFFRRPMRGGLAIGLLTGFSVGLVGGLLAVPSALDVPALRAIGGAAVAAGTHIVVIARPSSASRRHSDATSCAERRLHRGDRCRHCHRYSRRYCIRYRSGSDLRYP